MRKGHVDFVPLKKLLQPPRRRCPFCGTRFQPTRNWQRFDTTTCRVLYWQHTHDKQWKTQATTRTSV